MATANATRNGSHDDAADLEGHLPGDGVDAGAEDVADDEQQQQLGPITRLSSGWWVSTFSVVLIVSWYGRPS